jgi:hypothetical protein
MKMRYEARMQDLGPGDFVKVECAACGHGELASDQLRIKGQALPPYTPGARSCRYVDGDSARL